MSIKPLRVAELSSSVPHDRIFIDGPEALTNEELLALILSARRLAATLMLSRELLADGLEALRRRSFANGEGAKRFGKRSATVLSAFLEFSRRLHAIPPAERLTLGSPERIGAYLQSKARDLGQERVGALLLDARSRLLFGREIVRGTLESAQINPRDVLKVCLAEDAAGFILYHNHPSGDPTPSRDDVTFTRALSAAAKAVGVRFLDHVVVGREGSVSMSERGLLGSH